MGENWRACHLCMWKPLIFTLRIGMKTLKVFIEKVRTAHHWFLPVFALEHLQQCSIYDLRKYFSHPSLVMYSFATPPIKLKLGQQIGAGLLIANHVDQSIWWANLLSSSQTLFSTPFSAGTLHQPRQAMWLIMWSQIGICCVFFIWFNCPGWHTSKCSYFLLTLLYSNIKWVQKALYRPTEHLLAPTYQLMCHLSSLHKY